MNKYLEQLLDIEVIAKSEPASMLHAGNKHCSGRLILSGKRILFICNNNEEPEIDIDLDTINALQHESFFVDKNILAINYLQYEIARFSVLDYDSWETAIEQQRMKPHVKPAYSIHALN